MMQLQAYQSRNENGPIGIPTFHLSIAVHISQVTYRTTECH